MFGKVTKDEELKPNKTCFPRVAKRPVRDSISVGYSVQKRGDMRRSTRLISARWNDDLH